MNQLFIIYKCLRFSGLVEVRYTTVQFWRVEEYIVLPLWHTSLYSKLKMLINNKLLVQYSTIFFFKNVLKKHSTLSHRIQNMCYMPKKTNRRKPTMYTLFE